MVTRKAQVASGGRGARKFAAAAAVIACAVLQAVVTRRVGVAAQLCNGYPMTCGYCDPGWLYFYSPVPGGQAQCCPCPAGQYQPACGQQSRGNPCKAGTYSGSGQPSCTPCAAGTYNPSTSSTACLSCAAGTYNPNTSSTSSAACLSCAAGTYSGSGQPSCTPCAAGTYNLNTASISSAACLSCPPSYFCPDPAEDKQMCPVGSYCPAGTYAPNACQSGFLCNQQGLAQQVACPSGHYCPSAVQNTPCPAGTFSSATGALALQLVLCATHARASGQTSESTCLPCSSSQSCPLGTSVPTEAAAPITTAQIVAYACSAVASIVAVVLGFSRLYPFIKDRIAKLRQAGIKPTLKRVIFLQKTLSKYQPLLHPADRPDAAAAANSNAANSLFSQDFMTSVSASSAAAAAPAAAARIVTGTVTSVPIPPHAPPALLRLTAKQIGDCVAAIGPVYADYRKLVIDNSLTGKYIASNAESDLATTLGDIGISKKLHVSRILDVLMQLKCGDEAALAAACCHPPS